MPAYNEEKNIDKTLTNILEYSDNYDILVINDGSIDNTSNIVKNKMEKRSNLKLISHKQNYGGGKAVQTGIIYALRNGYEYSVQMDADGQHRIDDMFNVLNPVINNQSDLVIGSRYLKINSYVTSPVRKLGITILSLLVSVIIKQKITDLTSGFKGMNRKTMKLFSIDYPWRHPAFESVLNAAKNGLKIIEVPVKMEQRKEGQSEFTIIRMLIFPMRILYSLIKVNINKKKELSYF